MEKLWRENEFLKASLKNNEIPHSKGFNSKQAKLEHEFFDLKIEYEALVEKSKYMKSENASLRAEIAILVE